MSDSDKFTTTRPCSPDEVPAWAKDGTKRHNRKTIYKRTSLAPGWCQKPVIVLGSGDWQFYSMGWRERLGLLGR